MRFLTSTPRGVFEYNNGKVELKCKGWVYGLTHSENEIFVFERANNNTGTKLNLYDKNFQLCYSRNLPEIIDNHQAHYDPKSDRVAIANTRKNCITLFSPNGPHALETRNFSWRPAHSDINHINSCWNDGSRWFFLEHNGKSSSPGKALSFDNHFQNERCVEVPKNCHNVYVEDNWLFTTYSINSAMVAINMNTGEKRSGSFKNPINSRSLHTRGLARPGSKDYFLVGGSVHTERGGRLVKIDAVVLKVSNDFKLIEYYVIPDGNQIYEIRILDQPDLAHNGVMLK